MHTNSELFFIMICTFLNEVISQSTTPVNKCTRNYGDLPLNVIIDGCYQQPCKIRKGSTAKVHVEFMARHYIQSATTYATAYVTFFGFPISLDLGDYRNTCKYIGNIQCPIHTGESVHLSIGVYVGSEATVGFSVPVEFFVVDEDRKTIGCIRVEIEIVDSNYQHEVTRQKNSWLRL